MPDQPISDEEVVRLTRAYVERRRGRPVPPDLDQAVMLRVVTTRRRAPIARVAATGLMVAVVAAVAVVALVVHFGNSASATKAAGGWSVVSAPTPTSITVQLNGVSCVNDADC